MNNPVNHTRQFDLLPFWTINAGLDLDRLCGQLNDMQRAGFDGAVWHPRFYPDIPPYLSSEYFAVLSRVILHAKSLGMKLWLYDENGWPSGIAGGALPRLFPDYRTIWLTTTVAEPASGTKSVCSFELNGERVHLVPQRGHGLDYLNPAAVRQFFALALDSHRSGLAPEAFDYIDAVFTDEPVLGWIDEPAPRHGIVPWTPALPVLWRDRFGEDLVGQLPLLFRRETGSAAFRIRFREFVTDLFVDSFFAPYDRWCRDHGKRFTGHVKGEEHPLFQVPLNGSCHRLFQHMALPGIDALERYPHHNYYPRLVASAARQFGDGQAMAECFGGSGWGVEPQHLLNYLGWLAGNGITTFVLHLYQYQLNSAAVRDWPPSIPNHLTWRDAFPAVIREFRRSAMQRPSLAADPELLVVAPQRAVMAEYEPWELAAFDIHKCARYADSPAACVNRAFLDRLADLDRRGVPYHLCDERTLEERGRASETGEFRLGNCSYRQLLVPDSCRLTAAGAALAEPFRVDAGQVETTACSVVHTAAGGQRVTVAPVWQIRALPENAFVLEPESAEPPRRFSVSFTVADATLLAAGIRLVLLDPCGDITINGEPGSSAADGTAWRVDLTGKLRVGQNTVRGSVQTADGGALFLYLVGRFAVRSQSPFADGPNQTRRTAGPWVLVAEPVSTDPTDLLAAGYPFCVNPVGLVAEFATSALPGGARLSLGQLAGAAAWVSFNGHDCGWCWGPAWEIDLPTAVPAGTHRVDVLLFPNTLNFFGPHHHLDGDLTVTSPGQFSGRKNFADRPTAPSDTRVSAWHFRPFGTNG